MPTTSYTSFSHAMQVGHTDRKAFEIVRHVSDKTIEIRRLNAKLLNGVNSGEPDALQFEQGGFCGHVSGVQRYEYSKTAEGVIRIRRHGGYQWKDRHGNRFVLATEPSEFYDFNF